MHPFFIYFLILTSILIIYYVITITKEKIGGKTKKGTDEEEFDIPSGKETIMVEEDYCTNGFVIRNPQSEETAALSTPQQSISPFTNPSQSESIIVPPITQAVPEEQPKEEDDDQMAQAQQKATAMLEGLEPIEISSTGAVFEDDFDNLLKTHDVYTPKPTINRIVA